MKKRQDDIVFRGTFKTKYLGIKNVGEKKETYKFLNCYCKDVLK